MKKLAILTITLVTLFSCSSDDEKSLDPIIGTWGVYTDEDGQTPNDCLKKGTLVFLENGNTTSQEYLYEDDKCIADEIEKAKWSRESAGVYIIIEEGETDNEKFELTFEDNNNIMKLKGSKISFKRK